MVRNSITRHIRNCNFCFIISALPCEECNTLENVAMVVTSWGGHIGFMDGIIPRAPFLMERLFCQYASAVLPRLKSQKTAVVSWCFDEFMCTREQKTNVIFYYCHYTMIALVLENNILFFIDMRYTISGLLCQSASSYALYKCLLLLL